MSRPNVILLCCDQLRAFSVGCYGNTTVHTPNIDRLAGAGTRFHSAVSNNPVCTPARSVMLTGQYSRTCAGMLGNVHDNPANPRRERLVDATLPETLQHAGYHTVLIGKWHVDPQPQLVGFDSAVYPDFEHRYYGQRYWNERGESWTVQQFANDYELASLRQCITRSGSDPFFVFYNIGQPHMPIGSRDMPRRYADMYDRNHLPLRANVPAEIDRQTEKHWCNIYTSADYFWRYLAGAQQDPDDLVSDAFGLRDLTALYYAAVTLADDYLGAVIDMLHETGCADNTIIVFVSDHGDNLGSHGLFNKNALIEESIRVPFIVSDPRSTTGHNEEDTVASLVDIMPTVLDLTHVPVPSSVQGCSLAAAVRGADTAGLPRQAFIETADSVGIRTPRYLYGLGYDPNAQALAPDQRLFYDLQADPYELTNLGSQTPENLAAERDELDRLVRAWDRDTPWLLAPPVASIWEYLRRSGWINS